jgi:hypothetical protein
MVGSKLSSLFVLCLFTDQFWLNACRYPVWASLTRDYLAIMSSSVSSERAFSSAGITISKRRNCLKPDIVEALQVLKCTMKRELLFRRFDRDDAAEDGENGKEAWDESLDKGPNNYDPDSDVYED